MSKKLKETKPLVSIIITTYNRKDMLKRALNSVLKQDYENMEIIVSDNHSTDDTNLLMNEYLEKYSNIKYIRRDKNYGAFYNGQKAYKESCGKYILFLSDDDYMMGTTFIKNAVNIFENNDNVVLVSGFVLMFFEEYNQYLNISYHSENLVSGIDYLIRRSTVSLSGKYAEIISLFFLIRREAIEDNPTFKSFESSGDISLIFYSSSLGDIYFLHEYIGCYNLHENIRETSDKDAIYTDIDNTLEFIDILVERYCDLYPKYSKFFKKYIPIKIADVFLRDRIYKTFYYKNHIKKEYIAELKNIIEYFKEKNKIIYDFLFNIFFPKLSCNFDISLFRFSKGNIDFALFRINRDEHYLQINILGMKLTIKKYEKQFYKIPKLYAYASRDIKKGDKIESYYILDKVTFNQISSDIEIKDFIATTDIIKGMPITKSNSVKYKKEKENL